MGCGLIVHGEVAEGSYCKRYICPSCMHLSCIEPRSVESSRLIAYRAQKDKVESRCAPPAPHRRTASRCPVLGKPAIRTRVSKLLVFDIFAL